jgi:uncharacterized protein
MTMTPIRTPARNVSTGPWWRHPMMWLVVGGPLAVVVAALVTAVIAIRGADDILEGDARSQQAGSARDAYAPAVAARNHVVTPVRE